MPPKKLQKFICGVRVVQIFEKSYLFMELCKSAELCYNFAKLSIFYRLPRRLPLQRLFSSYTFSMEWKSWKLLKKSLFYGILQKRWTLLQFPKLSILNSLPRRLPLWRFFSSYAPSVEWESCKLLTKSFFYGILQKRWTLLQICKPSVFTRLRSRRVVLCLVMVYVRSFVPSFPHTTMGI